MKYVKGARYQIIYLDQNNHISSRNIKVVEERHYSVLAYCFEKRGMRTFLKDGILGVKKLASDSEWIPTRRSNH